MNECCTKNTNDMNWQHSPIEENADNSMEQSIDEMITNWVEFTEQIIQTECQNAKWTIWFVTLLLLPVHQGNGKFNLVYTSIIIIIKAISKAQDHLRATSELCR